jgi:hypothetical protein
VVKATPRPLYPRERPGTHCMGGGLDPRVGLDGGGKFCFFTGILSQDRPARSESVYRLRYPGPLTFMDCCIYFLSPVVVFTDFSIIIRRYFSDNKVKNLIRMPVKNLNHCRIYLAM